MIALSTPLGPSTQLVDVELMIPSPMKSAALPWQRWTEQPVVVIIVWRTTSPRSPGTSRERLRLLLDAVRLPVCMPPCSGKDAWMVLCLWTPRSRRLMSPPWGPVSPSRLPP